MRLAIVGVDDCGSLARSFASGAEENGHAVELIHQPQLVAGSRSLFLARSAGLDQLAARRRVSVLRETLIKLAPDLVLVVKGRFLKAPAVRELRRITDAPIVNYYPDHPLWPGHDDPEIRRALAEYDDVVIWGDEVAHALMREGVSRVRVVPFGYDPSVYFPPPAPIAPRWDVTFIGQCYEARLRFLEPLAPYHPLVSGAGWRAAATGGPLAGIVSDRSYPGHEACAMYWRSQVAINILADWNVPAHNMRSYEIPASQTAMVATRTPYHEALFGEDGAMLVDTPQEVREAVRMLLADDELRERIARRGRERVEPHTYAARMRDVLDPWEQRLLV